MDLVMLVYNHDYFWRIFITCGTIDPEKNLVDNLNCLSYSVLPSYVFNVAT